MSCWMTQPTSQTPVPASVEGGTDGLPGVTIGVIGGRDGARAPVRGRGSAHGRFFSAPAAPTWGLRPLSKITVSPIHSQVTSCNPSTLGRSTDL